LHVNTCYRNSAKKQHIKAIQGSTSATNHDPQKGAQQFTRREHPKDRRKHKKKKIKSKEEEKKNSHIPLHIKHIETTLYIVNFNDNIL
jgi:hypothetical protein